MLRAADRLEPARFREQVAADASRIRGNLELVRFKTDFSLELGAPPARDPAALESYLSSMGMEGTLKTFRRREAERAAKAQGELF